MSTAIKNLPLYATRVWTCYRPSTVIHVVAAAVNMAPLADRQLLGLRWSARPHLCGPVTRMPRGCKLVTVPADADRIFFCDHVYVAFRNAPASVVHRLEGFHPCVWNNAVLRFRPRELCHGDEEDDDNNDEEEQWHKKCQRFTAAVLNLWVTTTTITSAERGTFARWGLVPVAILARAAAECGIPWWEIDTKHLLPPERIDADAPVTHRRVRICPPLPTRCPKNNKNADPSKDKAHDGDEPRFDVATLSACPRARLLYAVAMAFFVPLHVEPPLIRGYGGVDGLVLPYGRPVREKENTWRAPDAYGHATVALDPISEKHFIALINTATDNVVRINAFSTLAELVALLHAWRQARLWPSELRATLLLFSSPPAALRLEWGGAAVFTVEMFHACVTAMLLCANPLPSIHETVSLAVLFGVALLADSRTADATDLHALAAQRLAWAPCHDGAPLLLHPDPVSQIVHLRAADRPPQPPVPDALLPDVALCRLSSVLRQQCRSSMGAHRIKLPLKNEEDDSPARKVKRQRRPSERPRLGPSPKEAQRATSSTPTQQRQPRPPPSPKEARRATRRPRPLQEALPTVMRQLRQEIRNATASEWVTRPMGIKGARRGK